MRGKLVVAGLVGAILLISGLIFWVGLSGHSTHLPPSEPGIGFTVRPDSGPPAIDASAPGR